MAKNEIQKTDQASPNEMIRLAIEGNADLEKLEKLLDLQERYERNEARKSFSSDFSVVQANIAAVVKTKNNPQTNSKYAGLDNVLESSKPVYTKQGFSIIFYEGKTDVAENVRVCADVLHKAGHKETYHLDVPLGGVGIKGVVNMTKIHAKATSVTYGRRYLLCMIWNIPTQDDDGNVDGDKKPELPKLTAANKKALAAICKILQKSLPSDRIVDSDRVAGIFFAQKGYPEDVKRAGAAAAWLIGSQKENSWTKETGVENTNKSSPSSSAGSEAAGTEAGSDGPVVDDAMIKTMIKGCKNSLREAITEATREIAVPPKELAVWFCKLCSIVCGGEEADYTKPENITVDVLSAVNKQIEHGLPPEILDAFGPEPDAGIPIKEAEKNAEEKFGTYYRYKCNKQTCGKAFHEPANGNCPDCLSKDITDNGLEPESEAK